MKRYDVKFDLGNEAEKEVEYGFISYVQVTIRDLQEDEERHYTTYVGYSLDKGFDEQDLEPYEAFGLDTGKFFSDFQKYEGEDICITDTEYGLDGEKYETWQKFEGLKNIYEEAIEADEPKEVLQELWEMFFEACEEYIECIRKEKRR